MQFQWDPRKNETNIVKHGIDFADAPRLFSVPMRTFLDTREDHGEDRWIGLGMLGNHVVVVAFTEPDEETIRIISIRPALPREQKDYGQYIRQLTGH